MRVKTYWFYPTSPEKMYLHWYKRRLY